MKEKEINTEEKEIITEEKKIIKISDDCFIDININGTSDTVLIIGNTSGFFGYYRKDEKEFELDERRTGNIEHLSERLMWLQESLNNGTVFTLIGNQETIEYYNTVFTFFRRGTKFNWKKQICIKPVNENNDLLEFMSEIKKKGQKFDYIIQNPPYSGSLHLQFFENGLDMLTCDGKMIIIEPANSLYTDFKKQEDNDVKNLIFSRIEHHVTEISFINVNEKFNVGLRCPFSITHIDMSKTVNDFDINVFGEIRKVNKLEDVNLVGSIRTLNYIKQQIKSLIKKFGSQYDHQLIGRPANYNKVKSDNLYYLANNGDILTHHGYDSENDYVLDPVHNVKYYGYVTNSYVYKNRTEITVNPKIEDKAHPVCYTMYADKDALNVFKQFILTNNLAHFISIVWPGNNNYGRKMMPFITDPNLVDEKIYDEFDKSDINLFNEAVELINHTCKNFQKDSDFFKAYEGHSFNKNN